MTSFLETVTQFVPTSELIAKNLAALDARKLCAQKAGGSCVYIDDDGEYRCGIGVVFNDYTDAWLKDRMRFDSHVNSQKVTTLSDLRALLFEHRWAARVTQALHDCWCEGEVLYVEDDVLRDVPKSLRTWLRSIKNKVVEESTYRTWLTKLAGELGIEIESAAQSAVQA